MNPSVRTLVLVPTLLEAKHLIEEPKWTISDQSRVYHDGLNLWSICGVGPAAASFSAGLLIGKYRPDRVLLLGIAGAYHGCQLQVDDVVQATSECFADLGHRDDAGFHTLDSMNLPMLPFGEGHLGSKLSVDVLDPTSAAGPFLTLSTITSDAATGKCLQSQFSAVAENMEGAGVALACTWHQVPFYQVRAVSNMVGPRDPKSWSIGPSLAQLKRWIEPHLRT